MLERDYTRVSIAVPTRNRKVFLNTTLVSLQRQERSDMEAVVSDNWSTDGSDVFLQGLQCTWITYCRPLEPTSMEMNIGNAVRQARGRYLMVLSDDDLLLPHYLDRMVTAFDRSNDVSVGLGRRILIDDANCPINVAPPLSPVPFEEDGAEFLLKFLSNDLSPYVNTILSTFYRRDKWLAVGGLPVISASFYSDTIPFISCILRGKVYYDPEAYFCYRLHGSNTFRSSNAASYQQGLKDFFKHVDIRRADWCNLAGRSRWVELESHLERYIHRHYQATVRSL